MSISKLIQQGFAARMRPEHVGAAVVLVPALSVDGFFVFAGSDPAKCVYGLPRLLIKWRIGRTSWIIP
jgi:hypothetical protein